MNLRQLVQAHMDALQEDQHRRETQGFDVAHPFGQVARLLRPQEPQSCQRGQIWSVQSANPADMPCLVVLTRVEGSRLQGCLVVELPWLASHDDFWLSAERSPTGEPLLLCTWRPVLFERGHLGGCVGALSVEVLEALGLWLERQTQSGVRLRAAGSEDISDGLTLISWSISKRSQPDQKHFFRTGSRILDDDDPRLELRTALSEATAYLQQSPVTQSVLEEAALPSTTADAKPTPPPESFWQRWIGWLSIPGPQLVLAGLAVVLLVGLVWVMANPEGPGGSDQVPGGERLKGVQEAQLGLEVFEWRDGRAVSIEPSRRPSAPNRLVFDVETNQPGHLSLWHMAPDDGLQMMAAGVVHAAGPYSLSPESNVLGWVQRGLSPKSGTWNFDDAGRHRFIVVFRPDINSSAPDGDWVRRYLPEGLTRKLVVDAPGEVPSVMLVDELVLEGL